MSYLIYIWLLRFYCFRFPFCFIFHECIWSSTWKFWLWIREAVAESALGGEWLGGGVGDSLTCTKFAWQKRVWPHFVGTTASLDDVWWCNCSHFNVMHTSSLLFQLPFRRNSANPLSFSLVFRCRSSNLNCIHGDFIPQSNETRECSADWNCKIGRVVVGPTWWVHKH